MTAVNTDTPAGVTTNHDVVRALRELADWIETHPELPAVKHASVSFRADWDRSPFARSMLTDLADALGDRAIETAGGGEVRIEGRFLDDPLVYVHATAKISALTDAPPEDPPYEPIIAAVACGACGGRGVSDPDRDGQRDPCDACEGSGRQGGAA